MRSSRDFIEVTGCTNCKKFLVNKSAIIFVTQVDNDENAVILTKDGEHMHKILTKESYKNVTEEILWNGFEPLPMYSFMDSPGEKEPEENENV